MGDTSNITHFYSPFFRFLAISKLFYQRKNIIVIPLRKLDLFFGRVFKCVDKGFEKNEPVDVVIRPEDIDIVAPEEGHLCGTVTSVTFKGLNYDIIVDFKGFKWLIQTTDFHPVGAVIGIRLNPEDIHIMRKSQYSGMFGDYSSYSEEYDELDDASFDLDEEESEDEE